MRPRHGGPACPSPRASTLVTGGQAVDDVPPTLPTGGSFEPSTGSQRRQHRQDAVVGRDLPLLSADRIEAHDAGPVDDEQCGTLAEAGEPADHVVGVENSVIGVGRRGEGVVAVAYESPDTFGGVRRDGHDGSAELTKPVDVDSQLREVPAAERSTEPAQENDYDRTDLDGLGEVELSTVLVDEGEVGGGPTYRRRSAGDAHRARWYKPDRRRLGRRGSQHVLTKSSMEGKPAGVATDTSKRKRAARGDLDRGAHDC